MSHNRNSTRRGSVTDKTIKQKAQTNRSEDTDTMPCRDCAVPVLDGEQGLKCDLCAHWLHAKCQKINEAAYNFLADNDNEAIKWYCSHCKPAALGVVTEVQKMAQKCQEMDKRMRKLETQIKLKANEADLEDLRNTFQQDLQDKASTEDLQSMKESTAKSMEDLRSSLSEETRGAIATATAEITKNIPTQDDIKNIIRGETSSAPQTSANATNVSETIDTREVVDINNRRNNIIIHRLPERPNSAFQSMGEQKSQMDMDEATNIIKTVTGESNTSLLTKCTRLGKAEKDKDRPLLLSFRETSHKENFMDNLKNLKGTQYQRISVVHDLTKKQREKLQELRNEAREKQSQDSGDWIYRVVGHPSMWTVKKMKRRTQHQAPNPESIPTTEEVTAESVEGKDPPPVGTARS